MCLRSDYFAYWFWCDDIQSRADEQVLSYKKHICLWGFKGVWSENGLNNGIKNNNFLLTDNVFDKKRIFVYMITILIH